MGELLNLRVPNGNSLDLIYELIKEKAIVSTIFNLKLFRSVYNTSMFLNFVKTFQITTIIDKPIEFVYNRIVEHLHGVDSSDISFIIFDKFDLWAFDKSDEEHEPGRFVYDCNVKLDTIERLDGIDDVVSKCDNWVYKLLFWLKNSIIKQLDSCNHNLYIICIYGNSYSSGPFFGDLFNKVTELSEFLNDYLSLEPKDLDELVEKGLLDNISSTISNNNCKSIPIDDIIISDDYNITISCDDFSLSNRILIYGKCGLDKGILLRCIVRLYCNKFNNLSIFRLDYYQLSSQYIGSGEAYIRNIFNKGRNNKPCLIYCDGIEYLFHNDEVNTNTVLKTLNDELYNDDNEIIFICCIKSSDLDYSDFNNSFVNRIKTKIELID